MLEHPGILADWGLAKRIADCPRFGALQHARLLK